jgi:acetyltransferase-like isoleucine patch superfamily enzyme
MGASVFELFLAAIATVREEVARSGARVRFNAYRRKMNRNGVFVHHDAQIFGVSGIEIQHGSAIHSRATLSAGFLHAWAQFDQPPRGTIRIGRRCEVFPGAIVATYGGNITIGDDVSINPGVIIYGHGNITIGDKTRIGAQSLFVASTHVYANAAIPIMEQGLTKEGIVIGRDVWIASGAKVFDGVTIGDSAVVSASSVVNRDVPPCTVVAGVPARAISKRRPPEELTKDGEQPPAAGVPKS